MISKIYFGKIVIKNFNKFSFWLEDSINIVKIRIYVNIFF